MNFRNLVPFRLPPNALPSFEVIEQALAEHQFAPCGETEPKRVGWVPALSSDSQVFAHTGSNGALLLRLREQVRLLPASVVGEQLAIAVEKREAAEGRKLGKKEIARLKDDLIFTLLPKAFTRSNDTLAIVLPAQNLILVGASTAKNAEVVLNALRLALGSLPVRRLAFSAPLPSWFTAWLKDTATLPADFTLGDSTELTDEEGKARLSGVDMAGDPLKAHLEHGMEAQKLELHAGDAMSFSLHRDARLSGIKMSDRLLGELNAENPEDELQARVAEFELWQLTLTRWLPPLFAALGEQEP